jgi:uncharacterized protein with ParB-like and HNH nuclease domain
MGNNVFSLKEILENDSYIIPRYQRNYAWGKKEISQLIKDIDEFFRGKNEKEKSYYLGSLVCFKGEDKDGRSCYELIDGQQRHITITLINLVLKNWKDEIVDNPVSKPNLKFDSRKKAQAYIENLYKTEKENFNNQIAELNVFGTGNFKDAIEIIQEDLRSLDNVKTFADNFFENVKLFRVEVPDDTDLNHYFEIMNNRGEQLEKHEIVKALLMGKIDQKDQEKFAIIWDACSDMSDYVYFNFDDKIRKELFDSEGNLSNNINDFSKIPITNSSDTNKKLADIINEADKYKFDTSRKEEKFIKEKYRSIIDFPNFLLQVLKLKYQDISLDDKTLVKQFEAIKPCPIEFIFDLLKYRTLFDKYVIKQDLSDADENKQNWSLRKLQKEQDYLIKTFGNPKENDEELVKIQVMLYYSNSTNTYNNWLQKIMKANYYEKNLEEYTELLFNDAKERFDKNNLSYPEVSIFNLYFIDLLLWKLYNKNEDELQTLKDKINKRKDLFNTFKFRQITSREHLLSQEHARRDKIDDKIYNGIGNLCLISTAQNSKGNKEEPFRKRNLFQNDNSSLKRLIMFESFENDKWKIEQIKEHEEMIMSLINYYV